jgi:hypothetical protein
MSLRRLLPAGVVALVVASSSLAFADERKFTYSEEAKVLPAGTWEFEQWATHQSHVEEGRFWELNLREEVEFGLTDRLTTAMYLNMSILSAHDVPGLKDETEFELEGVSFEAKYKLLDPAADAVGLLGYGEITVGEEFEVELKAVASKEMGAFTFAYNLVFAYERSENELEITSTGKHTEYVIENTLGGSYSFSKTFAGGVEFVARTPFQDNMSDREQTGYFIGPNAHYAAKDWWITATLLVRTNDADDFEKYEIRVIVGINF